MNDQSESETESEAEADSRVEEDDSRAGHTAEAVEDVVIDLDSVGESEAVVEELQERLQAQDERIEEQREQIEELESLLLDLSTRVADGRGMGVCPECHGPVQKMRRWVRPTTIECTRCGEVFHEY